MVVLRYLYALTALTSSALALPVSQNDAVACPSPLYHSSEGMCVLLAAPNRRSLKPLYYPDECNCCRPAITVTKTKNCESTVWHKKTKTHYVRTKTSTVTPQSTETDTLVNTVEVVDTAFTTVTTVPISTETDTDTVTTPYTVTGETDTVYVTDATVTTPAPPVSTWAIVGGPYPVVLSDSPDKRGLGLLPTYDACNCINNDCLKTFTSTQSKTIKVTRTYIFTEYVHKTTTTVTATETAVQTFVTLTSVSSTSYTTIPATATGDALVSIVSATVASTTYVTETLTSSATLTTGPPAPVVTYSFLTAFPSTNIANDYYPLGYVYTGPYEASARSLCAQACFDTGSGCQDWFIELDPSQPSSWYCGYWGTLLTYTNTYDAGQQYSTGGSHLVEVFTNLTPAS